MQQLFRSFFIGLLFISSQASGQSQLGVHKFENSAAADSVATHLTVSDVSVSSGTLLYQASADGGGGTQIGFSAAWNQASFSTSGKYLQYTLAAASGYQLTLSEISMRFGRTNTGPTLVTVQWSSDGFATAGTTLLNGGIVSSTLSSSLDVFILSTNLPTNTAQTVTLRIWGHDASGTGNLRFNDFRVFGTVSQIGQAAALQSSTNSLTGFTYVAGSGPSSSQSFNVSGTNLTSAPGQLSISASGTDYEVSSNNNSFGATTTINYNAATLITTAVFVRLKTGLVVANYNGQNLHISGGGASAIQVSLSGSVRSLIGGGVSSGAALRLSVDSLLFNTTSENGLDSAIVTVFNDGGSSQACQVYNFNIYKSKAFWTNDSAFTLAANSSFQLKVYFKPQHNISNNSVLVIRSNNGKGAVAIRVKGQGSYSKTYYSSSQNLNGEALRLALHSRIGAPYTVLGYSGTNNARLRMFGIIDNWHQNGRSTFRIDSLLNECVYTGRTITYAAAGLNTGTINNAPYTMNTEHSWPQSQGAGSNPMESDLHHLFITDGPTNSGRGNKPFDNVSSPTLTYTGGSKANSTHFEPRNEQKGATARAMLYFALRYYNQAGVNMGFYSPQESVLLGWHNLYPPTSTDKVRNDSVELYQNNRNPFVDYPQLMDRMSTLTGIATHPEIRSLYRPDSINFGKVVKNQQAIFKAVLANAGNQNIQISGISFTGSGMSYAGSSSLSIAAGEKAIVELQHTGTGADVQGSLQFTTDVPGSTSLNLPVAVVGAQAGWNGTGNWNQPAFWNESITPGSNDDVSIESGTATLVSATNAANLEVKAAATLVVAAGTSLTLSGVLTNNGTIRVEDGGALRPHVNSTLVGNGQYEVKRKGHSSNVTINFWSSPIENANLSTVFSNVITQDLYQFNTGTGWAVASGTMTAGRGYSAPGADQVSFNGKVHHGEYSPFSTVAGGGFYLIGNPYPSPLAADVFLTTNGPAGSQAISGTLYYWSQTTPANGSNFSSGDYASWAGGTGVAGSGSNAGSQVPNGQMGIAQGFFVKAGNVGGPIRFTNAMRTANSGQWFRTDGQVMRLWLRLTSDDSLFSQTALVFRTEASPFFDEIYDAPRMGDYAPMSLYSMLDSQQLAIQALPPFYDTLQIPLGYTNNQLRQLTLHIDSLSGDWTKVRLYLEDRYLRQLQPLVRGNALLMAGDTTGIFRDRYVLHLRQLQPTISTSLNQNANDLIQLRQNNRLLRLAGLPGAAQVAIYDLQGRCVQQKPASNQWEQTFEGAAGIYLLRVVAGKESWQRKIVITD